MIARRLREAKVYCEILPFDTPIERIKSAQPKGLIFSGGPSSVYQENAPQPVSEYFELGIPILGICYGMHVIGEMFGGKVEKASKKEFGSAKVKILHDSLLFAGLSGKFNVWMSHGDHLTSPPAGFIHTASSMNAEYAAVENPNQGLYLVQFHPEVTHTAEGKRIIRNFAYEICGVKGNWTPEFFISHSIEQIRNRLGKDKAICALSGGVDSTVAAALMHRATPEQSLAIFVDNGLLRNEDMTVIRKVLMGEMKLKVKIVEAEDIFLYNLSGITDPEHKRKIIGETFIRVFEEAAADWGEAKFLVQGTLYPDVIESQSVKGPSAIIKTHHNVGGLPEVMGLELIEPLKELFKDEVRQVGKILGLPESIVQRHPFPGPGLAVRILGEVTKAKLEILRKADAIFIDELKKGEWYNKVAQALCVLLSVKSVGVMGDVRTYEYVLALRSVDTEDFMTAQWSRIPYDLLAAISNRIINEVEGVNRVVYDISTKPPATVEWE